MPRRGDEIGYFNPETMEWVTTGRVGDPGAKDVPLFGPTAEQRVRLLEEELRKVGHQRDELLVEQQRTRKLRKAMLDISYELEEWCDKMIEEYHEAAEEIEPYANRIKGAVYDSITGEGR